MFDVNQFFENFKDRKNYDELSVKLQDASQLVFDGKYIKIKNINIPSYSPKQDLDHFYKELEINQWEEQDVEMVKMGIRLYKTNELKNDFEALSLCMTCKDLFPEKTELFDFIIEDLIKGTDNRKKYVELFDLNSDLVNIILFYMS